MSTTPFLASLHQPKPAHESNKTRIVEDLMRTKNYPRRQQQLLGCRRRGGSTFYYYRVPGAIIEIEIFWVDSDHAYHRLFSDVFDSPVEVKEMLGATA